MANRVHKNLLGHLYLFISFYIFIALTRRGIKNFKRAGLGWKSSCDADVNNMLKALLFLIGDANKSQETSSLVISVISLVFHRLADMRQAQTCTERKYLQVFFFCLKL